MSEFREAEIASLSANIVKWLGEGRADVEIKIAALKSAAAILDNAVSAKAQVAVLHNILNPPRR